MANAVCSCLCETINPLPTPRLCPYDFAPPWVAGQGHAHNGKHTCSTAVGGNVWKLLVLKPLPNSGWSCWGGCCTVFSARGPVGGVLLIRCCISPPPVHTHACTYACTHVLCAPSPAPTCAHATHFTTSRLFRFVSSLHAALRASLEWQAGQSLASRHLCRTTWMSQPQCTRYGA